ncbi:MAG: hypothetical protein MUP80_09790 [Acidobacteriia bacterium]|nr:hypothetical protein [Terriglobia bacterium]
MKRRCPESDGVSKQASDSHADPETLPLAATCCKPLPRLETVMGLVLCGGAVVFFGAFYLLPGQSQKKRSSPTGRNLVAFCVGGALSTFAALPIRAR